MLDCVCGALVTTNGFQKDISRTSVYAIQRIQIHTSTIGVPFAGVAAGRQLIVVASAGTGGTRVFAVVLSLGSMNIYSEYLGPHQRCFPQGGIEAGLVSRFSVRVLFCRSKS